MGLGRAQDAWNGSRCVGSFLLASFLIYVGVCHVSCVFLGSCRFLLVV